jgi:putative ABC transport system substrate-binding protein
MGQQMKRREFIRLLASAATGGRSPHARSKPAKPTIGFLNGTSPQAYGRSLLAFRRGLTSETGYVEGRNVEVEYRWAEGPLRATASIGGRFDAPSREHDCRGRRLCCVVG